VEAEALTLIARQSTGAMRDAISLLDQLASTGQAITLESAQAVLGTAASQAVLEVVNALVNQQADMGLESIHAALDAGSDPRQFARQIVDYLRDLLLIRMGNSSQVDATAEVRVQMANHAQKFSTTDLLRLIRVFNFAAGEARSAWQPALPLEMAFVEALEAPQGTESAGAAGASTAAPSLDLGAKPCPAETNRNNPSRRCRTRRGGYPSCSKAGISLAANPWAGAATKPASLWNLEFLHIPRVPWRPTDIKFCQ
jgi:DNA polymerase-3 subunit gamma/tau